MTPFTSHSDALSALRAYDRNIALGSLQLPQRLIDSLEEATRKLSPVDAAVTAAEALYAFRDDLDTEGRELAYRLIAFGNTMGFHRLGGERGTNMCKALLRDMQIAPPPGMEWPAADEDPEVDETYLVAAQVAAPPVPAGAPAAAD